MSIAEHKILQEEQNSPAAFSRLMWFVLSGLLFYYFLLGVGQHLSRVPRQKNRGWHKPRSAFNTAWGGRDAASDAPLNVSIKLLNFYCYNCLWLCRGGFSVGTKLLGKGRYDNFIRICCLKIWVPTIFYTFLILVFYYTVALTQDISELF